MVMKRLTSITILISIPTLIASVYGMNVKHLPYADSPYSFYVPVVISILISIMVSLYFNKKKWF
jgi:magnesium transporter